MSEFSAAGYIVALRPVAGKPSRRRRTARNAA
jgi:hypothetical protein